MDILLIKDPFEFLTPATGPSLKCKAGNCYQYVREGDRIEFQRRREEILGQDPHDKAFGTAFQDWALTAVCSRHRTTFREDLELKASFCEKTMSVVAHLKAVFASQVSIHLPSSVNSNADESEPLEMPSHIPCDVFEAYHQYINSNRDLTLDLVLELNPGPQIHSMHELVTKNLLPSKRDQTNVYVMVGKPIKSGGPPLVKVGSSKDHGDGRARDIVRICRFPGTANQEWEVFNFTCPHAYRIEQLIHTELRCYGYGVRAPCFGSHRNATTAHKEFYVVGKDIVIQMVKSWINWDMCFRPYGTDGKFQAWSRLYLPKLSSDIGNVFLLNSHGIPWHCNDDEYSMPKGECACTKPAKCLKRIDTAANNHQTNSVKPNVSDAETVLGWQTLLWTPSDTESDDDKASKSLKRKRLQQSNDELGFPDSSPALSSDIDEEVPHQSATDLLASAQSTPKSVISMPVTPSTLDGAATTRDHKRRATSTEIPESSIFVCEDLFDSDYIRDDNFEMFISDPAKTFGPFTE